MTERLYFNDSHLNEFSAVVTGQRSIDGKPGIVLNRTAFYPTGGGQPFDTGHVNGISVIDVVETDSGEIVHLISEGPNLTRRHNYRSYRLESSARSYAAAYRAAYSVSGVC